MNILGIDFGKKRIGLAWVQLGLDVVLPFGAVNNEQRTTNKLATLVRDEKIDKIIVGLPIGLDGKENENTERVRKFVEDLKHEIDIPIEFEDERFTTAEANRMGGDASADEKAAMLILQGYLEKQ
ncbi:MAG: Holliday junction resolvase RuvX [Candidatus Magasanikbacteria bacterium]